MRTARRWLTLGVLVPLALGTVPAAQAGVNIRVGPSSWRRPHHHHHCGPTYFYEPVPYYQPVYVQPAPIVERRVYVERPVYVQPPPQQILTPIQTDEAPYVDVQTPAGSVQVAPPQQAPAVIGVPAPAVYVRTKGRLPPGPVTNYTCIHSYTGVQFDVQIPAWMKPKDVNHGKTDIEIEYRDGEIEIEFRSDGSAVVDYDF